jgi:hypothetical protein
LAQQVQQVPLAP